MGLDNRDYTQEGVWNRENKHWSWLNNQDLLHRVDGPAWISGVNGHQEWYLHGKRHRVDGPAIIDATGLQEWYLHGQGHRVDGPAHIGASGSLVWYVQGRNITTEVEEWMQAHNITWPFTPEQLVEFQLRWV